MTLIGLYLPLESPLAHGMAVHLFAINLMLLVFNLLPIYPLDGGKILWCLLWFFLGQARSLFIASIIGVAGAAALVLFAIYVQNWWLIAIAAFTVLQCVAAFKRSRQLRGLEIAPPREEVRCPACGASPPTGNFWTCACGTAFDPFASNLLCTGCGRSIGRIPCTNCHASSPSVQWLGMPYPEPAVVISAAPQGTTPTTMSIAEPSAPTEPAAGIPPSPGVFSERPL